MRRVVGAGAALISAMFAMTPMAKREESFEDVPTDQDEAERSCVRTEVFRYARAAKSKNVTDSTPESKRARRRRLAREKRNV